MSRFSRDLHLDEPTDIAFQEIDREEAEKQLKGMGTINKAR